MTILRALKIPEFTTDICDRIVKLNILFQRLNILNKMRALLFIKTFQSYLRDFWALTRHDLLVIYSHGYKHSQLCAYGHILKEVA
ncbi:MAG TPA: hypothetical protein DCM07_23215 [Planctomycetaceae bacterium]|nr:hypothetical protein [Gimesia sp.]HAH47711.1 hypothetical protein [Planctomycetaceae bacterium]